jgi:hypothetical protein
VSTVCASQGKLTDCIWCAVRTVYHPSWACFIFHTSYSLRISSVFCTSYCRIWAKPIKHTHHLFHVVMLFVVTNNCIAKQWAQPSNCCVLTRYSSLPNHIICYHHSTSYCTSSNLVSALIGDAVVVGWRWTRWLRFVCVSDYNTGSLWNVVSQL